MERKWSPKGANWRENGVPSEPKWNKKSMKNGSRGWEAKELENGTKMEPTGTQMDRKWSSSRAKRG